MGKKSATSGISALRNNRIQFDFKFQGQRFCPTLLKPPTEANIRRACEKLIWTSRATFAKTTATPYAQARA
jgi:integrase